MAHYMLLIYSDPKDTPQPDTDEGAADMKAWFDVTEELNKSGVMVAGDALWGVEQATTVRRRDGERLTTDGPFAETKEHLGGFYVIDVPSIDEAIVWADKMPNVGYGSIEIRPIVDFSEMG